MKSIAIIYGSSTENTKEAANMIAEKLADYSPTIIDMYNIDTSAFISHEVLILGASTWGVHDLQDDWADFYNELLTLDLSGKTVALFGLGDSFTYPDAFADAMGILYEGLKDKGCKIIGQVSPEGYQFDYSRALINDMFVGLPLDFENDAELTEERITKWVASLKEHF